METKEQRFSRIVEEYKRTYQNLVEPGDPFDNGFYVPENVYIIGTMNDIDRGVESMDFAIRRRFAWAEVKVEDRLSMLDEQIPDWSDAAKRCMESLNAALKEKGIGLTSAYDIGPAYFLKLEQYDGEFEKLWDYHIKGIVTEYLRGTRGIEEKVDVVDILSSDKDGIVIVIPVDGIHQVDIVTFFRDDAEYRAQQVVLAVIQLKNHPERLSLQVDSFSSLQQQGGLFVGGVRVSPDPEAVFIRSGGRPEGRQRKDQQEICS